MSFLNSFSAYRACKRVYIKKRNVLFDKMRSVNSMVALAKHELSLANATFYSDMNNYATCLYMTDIVNLKNDEFNEEMDDFSKSRYFKFQEDVEALQNRIFKVIEATSDVVQKKVELRKIINKSIRMRKFYSY